MAGKTDEVVITYCSFHCHASCVALGSNELRGPGFDSASKANADLPFYWMLYVTTSIKICNISVVIVTAFHPVMEFEPGTFS